MAIEKLFPAVLLAAAQAPALLLPTGVVTLVCTLRSNVAGEKPATMTFTVDARAKTVNGLPTDTFSSTLIMFRMGDRLVSLSAALDRATIRYLGSNAEDNGTCRRR